MPGSCVWHRSPTGRMCNNHKDFCSSDKQDIGSLGHLNSEESDSMGWGGYTIVQGCEEPTSAVCEVHTWGTIEPQVVLHKLNPQI